MPYSSGSTFEELRKKVRGISSGVSSKLNGNCEPKIAHEILQSPKIKAGYSP